MTKNLRRSEIQKTAEDGSVKRNQLQKEPVQTEKDIEGSSFDRLEGRRSDEMEEKIQIQENMESYKVVGLTNPSLITSSITYPIINITSFSSSSKQF